MQQKQSATASKKVFPGFYVPPTAAESLVREVERGNFGFSAILDLSGDNIALISGKFQNDVISEITGLLEPDDGHNSSPISKLLSAHERQTCVLSCISVSDEFGMTGLIYDAATGRRTLEIETKIIEAIRGS